MTRTEAYSLMHRVLTDVGRRHGLTTHDMRVLVAIREAGREVRSNELEAMMSTDTSATRRSLLPLYARGLVLGCGPDGGHRKRGYRTRISILRPGAEIADAALTELAEAELAAQAATQRPDGADTEAEGDTAG